MGGDVMNIDVTHIYQWAWLNKYHQGALLMPCTHVWHLAVFCASEHCLTFTNDDGTVEYYDSVTKTWNIHDT